MLPRVMTGRVVSRPALGPARLVLALVSSRCHMDPRIGTSYVSVTPVVNASRVHNGSCPNRPVAWLHSFPVPILLCGRIASWLTWTQEDWRSSGSFAPSTPVNSCRVLPLMLRFRLLIYNSRDLHTSRWPANTDPTVRDAHGYGLAASLKKDIP